jgi:uncharacterized protein Yka (UPF0111/DUF47 family)
MLQRLIEMFHPWAIAMAGLDDPIGDYLSMLEERVRRLEREADHLRSKIAADTPTRAPGSDARAN